MTARATIRAVVLACAIAVMPVMPGLAQPATPLSNVVPEAAHVVLRAKIRGINLKSRQISLQSPAGERVTMKVGPGVRLEMLKVGETVLAEYYR